MIIALSLAALAALNLAVFLLMAWDKAAARRGRGRVPERLLLLAAALGGGPALELARRTLRHKTRKQPFGAWFALIVFVQLTALAAVLAVAWARRGTV